MANVIQVKRNVYTGTGNPVAANVAYGELAWNNANGGEAASKLWIGQQTGTNPVVIAPKLINKPVLGTDDEITVTEAAGSFTVSLPDDVTVGGKLIVTGDLEVTGTTTTVNSTTLTVDDPILTLGGDVAPTVDDNKDRGIEFRYFDDVGAKLGFFGWDDSATNHDFVFYKAATNSSEVFSGTVQANLLGNVTGDFTGDIIGDLTGDVTGLVTGNVSGNVGGNVSGAVTGNVVGNVAGDVAGAVTGAVTGTVGGGVTGDITGDITGAVTGAVSGNVGGDVAGAVTGAVTGTVGGGVTGNITGNITGDITGSISGAVSGAISGNAATATALATAREIGGVSFDGSANINLPGVNAAGNQNTSGEAATLAAAFVIDGGVFS
jgi:hypothetical protein